MTGIVGQWGPPPDAVAMVSAIMAVALLLIPQSSRKRLASYVAARPEPMIACLALAAAAASLGYYCYYLRGGPRIINATYYWLQAKTFAKGHCSIPLLYPSAALRGRFLHYDAASGHLSVLFPPGYAAILAVGMVVHTPWLIGPAIAAALVVVTAALAERAFADKRTALIAALLSATCMALRYHTADTLSHGWAALLFATAIWAALGSTPRDAALGGLATGWLWATRPFTAVALVAAILLLVPTRTRKTWMVWGICVLPGVVGWYCYQRFTTGSWWQTTQSAYYAVADGPPGCFRYGFGRGIGCLFEHGTYVANRLPSGYGALAALTVSAVRLRWHMLDVLNFEPLWLLFVVAAVTQVRHRAARVLAGAPLLLIVAYCPFYFDGNFPGGGARLLADAIPLEHALIATWLVQRGRLVPVVVLALLGFSLHGAYEHNSLKYREGGRPMFEARTLQQAGVTRGLVLVDTDHGFGLGHDPGAHDAEHGVVVARARHDAHDWQLWEALGFPDLYLYQYDAHSRAADAKVQSTLLVRPQKLRFEAEAEWPVLAVHDAWAIPGYPPCACVSQQRALMVHPSGPDPTVTLALPVREPGQYRIRVGWVKQHDDASTIWVRLNDTQWSFSAEGQRNACGTELSQPIRLDTGEHLVQFKLSQNDLAIDWIQLEPAN